MISQSLSKDSSPTLTFPFVAGVNSHFHREGDMFRLAVMDHNHIPARERHLRGETDLRLGKKKHEETA